MRFDHLPTELLMMIATRSDMITRGRVVRTSKRMKAIYGKLPHYMIVDRVEFSRLKKGKTVYNRIVIHDRPMRTEICIAEKEEPISKYFSFVGQIDEFSVSDMDCGNYSVGNVLNFFQNLKVIRQLSFDNCFLLFPLNYLTETVVKYNVKSITARCSSVLNMNLQSMINDKFFRSYRGDFSLAVEEKKNISKTIAMITDETLYSLAENPRKVFKLENFKCQYTFSLLVGTVEAVIRNNVDVDWDLGVLMVGTNEISYFYNFVHQTLSETASAVNGFYANNCYSIGYDEEIYCEEFRISSERSQVKFTVQLDERNMTPLRKRPYKSSNIRRASQLWSKRTS